MSYDLNRTEDQRQILEAARSMLEEHYPASRLRGEPAPDDPGQLAAFGAFALALPEEAGGAGFTLVEEALLHVALGRHLLSPSSLAAPLAARMLAAAGRHETVTRIASGEVQVCAGISTAGGWLLFDTDSASLALIRDGDALRLHDLDGVDPQRETAMGHGRPLHRVVTPSAAPEALAAERDVTGAADLLVSAQLLGLARGALDLATDYAQTREQFGRPIGGFQAIKHHCADMALRAEMLSAQLDMAAIALRDGRADAGFQVAALARLAPVAALKNARVAIQIHGGLGFSAEADIHHYLKQAHRLRQLLGRTDLLALDAPLAPTRKEPPCASP